jgi:hypothetical protein
MSNREKRINFSKIKSLKQKHTKYEKQIHASGVFTQKISINQFR